MLPINAVMVGGVIFLVIVVGLCSLMVWLHR